MTSFGDMLADQAEQQAWWRGEKAKEYPADGRNAASAKALRELAEHLRGLPENHPSLWRAEKEYQRGQPPMEDVIALSGATSLLFSRYGFDRADETVDEFLQSLVKALVADRDEEKREADLS